MNELQTLFQQQSTVNQSLIQNGKDVLLYVKAIMDVLEEKGLISGGDLGRKYSELTTKYSTYDNLG